MDHTAFLIYAFIFLLSGFIARYRVWPAIAVSVAIPLILGIVGAKTISSIILTTLLGAIVGGGGALLIPIVWASRRGSTASSNTRFIIFPLGKSPGNFNWVNDENHSDNTTHRKRWTENK